MRAVVDTNILVRALIRPHGSVGPVLLRLRSGHYTLLYTQSLLEELVDVFSRPRIRDKYGVTEDDIKTVVALVLLHGKAGTVSQTLVVCRDPKDDKFLEAALAGNADVIVSGGEDLLVLDPFDGIPIVSPAEFLRRLDDEKS